MSNQLDSERNAPKLDSFGESLLTHLIPFTKSYAYDGELQLSDLIDSESANTTQEFFLIYSGKASVETIVHDLSSNTRSSRLVSSFDLIETSTYQDTIPSPYKSIVFRCPLKCILIVVNGSFKFMDICASYISRANFLIVNY